MRSEFFAPQMNRDFALGRLESLEPRLLYSGGSAANGQAEAATSQASGDITDITLGLHLAAPNDLAGAHALALPAGLPKDFSVVVTLASEQDFSVR